MSLQYKVVQRKNPQNMGAAARYFAEGIMRGKISFEEFLDAVCRDTTLNRDEVRMALNKAFQTILAFSKLGFHVHLDTLGYVKVSLRGEGKDTPEEVTANTVTDIVPHFVFSEHFRSELKKEHLERIG
jgi:predicted histone-like DNA-binding protein